MKITVDFVFKADLKYVSGKQKQITTNRLYRHSPTTLQVAHCLGALGAGSTVFGLFAVMTKTTAMTNHDRKELEWITAEMGRLVQLRQQGNW